MVTREDVYKAIVMSMTEYYQHIGESFDKATRLANIFAVENTEQEYQNIIKGVNTLIKEKNE